MSKFFKLAVYWLPPLLWMGLIFWLSSFHKLQASPVSWQDFIIRKTAHFLEYAILFSLYFRAFKKTTQFSIKKIIIFSLFLTILYSISDEYHQTKVNGRTGRIFDVLVDSLGGLFGLYFSVSLIKKLPPLIKKVFS